MLSDCKSTVWFALAMMLGLAAGSSNAYAAGQRVLLNVGGPAYVDSLGQTWAVDKPFYNAPSFSSKDPISKTSTPVLYQTQRRSPSTLLYKLTVPNSTYTVTLKFADFSATAAGQRQFNIMINGNLVASMFDVFALAGGANIAVDRSFPVTVTDGVMSIQLTSVVGHVQLNAIDLAETADVAISMAPASATLAASQTQQFTANVTGTSNTAVTWSMSPNVGTLTPNGNTAVYTAPSSISLPQTVTVTATSAAAPVRVASSAVSLTTPVTAPPTISVNITPTAASLSASKTQQFTATVSGGSNTAVSWKISPSVGTLIPNGNTAVYTAPSSITLAQTVTVTATSVANATRFASAAVSLTLSAPSVSVGITPTTATLSTTVKTQQFTASVAGTTNTSVTWKMSPNVGTIAPSGNTCVYTMPATNTTAQTVTVTATSVADPTRLASAAVSVPVTTSSSTPPTISISAPIALTSVSGTVAVNTVVGNSTVAGVRFLVDGVALGAEVTTPPYSINWNTLPLSNGWHAISAIARDATGNVATAKNDVVVNNDAQPSPSPADASPPVISFTAPTALTSVSGSVTVTVAASDDVGVVGVQFLADGVALGAEITTPPYAINWNTLPLSNGWHAISAKARDAAGNQTTAKVDVLVGNGGSSAPKPPITITLGVQDGAVVTGYLALSAQVSDPSAVASVEYQLDGKPLYELSSPIAPVLTPPYSYNYGVHYLYNGYKTLTAIAKSADGTVLGISAPKTIRVAATAPYSVRFSGFDLSATQSGSIAWVSAVDSNLPEIRHNCAIDGITLPTYDSDLDAQLNLRSYNPPSTSDSSYGTVLDTTRFPNGTHELFCTAAVPDGTKNSYVMWDATASLTKFVKFDNGHTPMAIRSQWQDMYLTLGQRSSLNPYVAYTDGTQDLPTTSGVTFTVDNPGVATVGADGTVTGVGEGMTYVRLARGPLVSKTMVVVAAVKDFRHFSRTSTISNSYVPGQSLFMRTLFFLDAAEISRDSTVGTALQNAGVNTVDGGFYCLTCRFTAEMTPTADYAAWYEGFASTVLRTDIPTAQKWNMALFATGDVIFRNVPQIHDFLNIPWTQTAFQTMLTTLRDSKVFLGADMVDETNLVFGNYPKPAGKVNASGPFTKVEVFGCPSVPCTGVGIVHYRYNAQRAGEMFQIRGSSVNALNGPHTAIAGRQWTQITADPSTSKITVENHGVTQNGIPARFSHPRWASSYPFSLPGGLSEGITYYLIVVDPHTLRVATTLADALAGRSLAITSAGSGTFVSFGMIQDGYPFNTNAVVGWTFTTQNVPNGVYSVANDPNLEIVILNPADWFHFAFLGKRIGVDGLTRISIASNTATATWSNHGLKSDQIIKIKNASNPKLNRPYRVTVLNSTTFVFNTISVADATVTPSTDPSLTVDIGFFPAWDNNIVRTILNVANEVPNRPALAWPVLGDSDNETVQRWMGDPTVSDFASLFPSQRSQPYDYGSSMYGLLHDMKAAAMGRLPYIQRSQPKLLLVSGGPAIYRKQTPGDSFKAGMDKLEYSPYRPETLTASILLAAEAGMSGVRVYGYQTATTAANVVAPAAIGTNINVMISPSVQPKKWMAMSNAFNFIKDLEAYILQPNISSPQLGPLVFTGAKEGNNGRLLMISSFSEVPQTLNIDFTPYAYGGTITRYRVSPTSYANTIIPKTSGEAITLAPGETAAYLFQ